MLKHTHIHTKLSIIEHSNNKYCSVVTDQMVVKIEHEYTERKVGQRFFAHSKRIYQTLFHLFYLMPNAMLWLWCFKCENLIVSNDKNSLSLSLLHTHTWKSYELIFGIHAFDIFQSILFWLRYKLVGCWFDGTFWNRFEVENNWVYDINHMEYPNWWT